MLKRSLPLLALTTLLALAALAALPAVAAPSRAEDPEIVFWTARVERDPADFLSPTRLGNLCLRKARETGDFSLYLQAEKAASLALERNPNHLPAKITLASAYRAQHKFKQAVPLAEEVVRAQPDSPDGYAELGDALLEMGEVKRAEAIYARLKSLAPGMTSLARLANLTHLKGDVPGAIRYLALAAESGKQAGVQPEAIAWCYTNMGEMNWSTGKWSEAERYYRRALQITPNGYLPLEHLAELRAAQGRHAEALKLYDRVISLNPAPEFYEAKAGVLAALGRKREAKELEDRARDGFLKEVGAGNIGLYRHLSRFFAEVQPNPAEALKWAQKDLEVRQDVHAYDTLAWALYLNERVPEAVAASRKALALGTRDAEMFYHAGMIHRAAGNRSEAAKWLAKALETNPRMEEAAQIRTLLKQLAPSRRKKRVAGRSAASRL